MIKSKVLIIGDDEWMTALLQRHLEHAGFEVHLESEARTGYRKACELAPDCVICDDQLPDIDGFWVIKKLRSEAGRAGRTPILLLTEDIEALQGANVGADLFLTKPLNNDEVVAQVGALIEMARRLQAKHDSVPHSIDSRAALRGDIAHMSIATVMTVLEMERRTGELTVETEGHQKASLRLFEGMLVSPRAGATQRDAAQLLRDVLQWKTGRFWFNPTKQDAPPDAERQSVGMILLEAARLEDEAQR